MLFVCALTLLEGLLIAIPVPANSQVLYEQHFEADAIASGEWIASDPSISVDTASGVLKIGQGSGFDSHADVLFPMPLPAIVEARMRLTGGQNVNYTLPLIGLLPGLDTAIVQGGYYTVYLPGSPYGWDFMNNWTDLQAPSVALGEWITVRQIIETGKGDLFIKRDADSTFTHVIAATWEPIPSDPDPGMMFGVRFIQPWDATCELDYVRVTSSSCYDRLSDCNCDGFEDAVDLALHIDRIFFGGPPCTPCTAAPTGP